MPILTITTESAYRDALDQIASLMHAKKATPAGRRLNALVVSAVEKFEEPLHYVFTRADTAKIEAPVAPADTYISSNRPH